MTYLDASPMIIALHTHAADFDMSDGRLNHIPSGHKIIFDPFGGSARVEAHCNCATLHISRSQSQELKLAYLEWKESYWRAVEINREFASHFRPSLWRRVCVQLLRVLLEPPQMAKAKSPAIGDSFV